MSTQSPQRAEPDLLYSEDEEALRAAVRDLLTDHCDAAGVIARAESDAPHDRELWKLLADGMGLAGLLVPEELGGQGATHREAAVVLEELGRSVAPVPYLTSAVVATEALLATDAGDLLGDLASGRRIGALAVALHLSAGSAYKVVRFEDGALHGELTGIADAAVADVLLVPADDGGLYAVDTSAVTVTPQVSLDLTRPLATVTLDGAPGRLLGDAEPAVRRALRAGAGLLASEQLGLAEWTLTETVRYLKERKQFNRPVGGFQALKHRLAQLWLEVVNLRAAARNAADRLATGGDDADLAVAVAQAFAAPVAVHTAEEALQLHGGIGMTWEHPVHLYLKRAKADSIAYGTAGAHRAALAELVDLQAP
ncbi:MULTISPECIES: acyl-CoA dehydrogenase family protein [Streptomyces]|uniref:Acyl-CoA/acyl-ACP dehydrogenase n=1 Tax=Streptomyces caniscabiei TaxID=2746961 RepID=A0ABU4ML41_9ACTN|nr:MULTISPECIES: acyl-CoA dehydrogenase family protein [Streptomyces]MBE4739163.1 acyl-CoA/acyl-ACP dehydrogenase [Streptomyces caniscabiei]MBE4758546.1 acyl-CoA/acyl-ACP dehydrogenase [Streptomyces caniscabiei]MBE4771904.1 acyl-CoA/acyl-ACP dehydrogenase [Streptomyces caniscabiei]MBE4787965.1 acyl-CoA/acyl-ACP dehydrogenase [Streptomyces caniscabiei]MBE4797187.1 acyl-CoA/acyl-ACP dehydrogenase [Streptomyces caniscabiei]